jgi:Na+/H+-dicarboxylate symporter
MGALALALPLLNLLLLKDGTALYEAVSAIFIAQMNHRAMGIGEVIIVR